MTGTESIRKGYFLYFDTIGVNLMGGFKTFRRGNNNSSLGNNNNSLLLLPLLEFREGFGEGFNPPLGENLKELDFNIIVLVNALIGVNLGINHVKGELNHIKLIEFRKIEIKDLNE